MPSPAVKIRIILDLTHHQFETLDSLDTSWMAAPKVVGFSTQMRPCSCKAEASMSLRFYLWGELGKHGGNNPGADTTHRRPTVRR